MANPATLTLTQSGGAVAATPVYVRFNRADEGASSGDITHTSTGATTQNVAVSGTAAVPLVLSAGDVIISGFQATNSVSGQNPAEFVELFNTTDQTIPLGSMNILLRVDTDGSGGGGVVTDWQLSDESPV